MIAPPLKKVLEKINAMVKKVEAELTALVGDSSLCLMTKEGRAPNAVKYNEGKYHALNAARRLIGQMQNDESQVSTALKEALGQAEKLLAHYRSQSEINPDWLSYYQGEAAGYAEVISLFEA